MCVCVCVCVCVKMLFIYCTAQTVKSNIVQNSAYPYCRIHRLHLCRRVRHPPLTSDLVMTLNNLMVRFQ